MSRMFFPIFLSLFSLVFSENSWFSEVTRVYKNVSTNGDHVIVQRLRESTNLKNFTHLLGSFGENYECLSLLNREIDIAEKNLANLTECLDADTRLRQLTRKPCMDLLANKLRVVPFGDHSDSNFERFAKCVEKISPVLQEIEDKNFTCFSSKSIRQIVSEIYKDIAFLELKNYVFRKILFLYTSKFDGDSSMVSRDLDRMAEKHLRVMADTHEQWRENVGKLSMSVENCGAENPVAYEGYQKFLTYSLDIIDHSELCRNQSNFCRAKSTVYDCLDDKNCQEDSQFRQCSGIVTECQRIEKSHLNWGPSSENRVKVCPANSTSKRYDYIEFDEVHWGKADCDQKIRFVDFVRRTNNSDPLKKHKYLHLCTCIEKSKAKINVDNVISDIYENKIITGIRFLLENNTLGLQIEQGRLGPFGSINQSSIEWQTPDWKLKTNTKIHEIGYENDEIFLDDSMNLEGSVLIGVKFKTSKHPENGKVGVKLAILTTPFNFTTGELSKGKHSWETSYEYERLERDLDTENHHKKGSAKRYVRFQTSSLVEDVGQTMLPKLDTQQIFPNPRVPLSGVGLDYKSGFLKLRLLTHDAIDQPMEKLVALPAKVEHYLQALESA